MIKFITAGLLFCIMLSSCLTSVQPLVTYETITEENRLVGTWQQGKENITVEELTKSEIFKEIDDSFRNKDEKEEKIKLKTAKERQDSIFYSHAYSVSYVKEGIKYYMIGSLTRISNQLFLEMYPIVIDDPERPDGSGLDFTFNFLPTVTIAKVTIQNNNSVRLDYPDGDYIKAQISSGNMRLKHEKDDWFQTFLITASTRDLRAFLDKYGNDERLFISKNSVTLTRKG